MFNAIETVRPGVPCRDVLRAAFAVNDRAGFSDFSAWCLEFGWSAIVHSLGLDLREQSGVQRGGRGGA